MIKETLSRRQNPALTSDRWHVVHSRWAGEASGEPSFQREIVSEHDDREGALGAARDVLASIAKDMAARPREQRDQVFVRKPAYKSLKTAGRIEKREA